jgi:hypothetical protein
VLGRTEVGWEMVLDADELEECGASVDAFEARLIARMEC